MRAKDIIPAEKPRNFVAKNAKMGGAGQHKDKKKAEKQGDVKHKGKEFAEDVAEARKANSASARAEFGKRPRKDTLSDKEKDQKKSDSDADWERLMAYAAQQKKEQGVEEGEYKRPGSPTAYDRDYASSVSGMGHKDSLAYRMDGGANDEGEDDAPYQHKDDKPVLKGHYFYNVPPGKPKYQKY